MVPKRPMTLPELSGAIRLAVKMIILSLNLHEIALTDNLVPRAFPFGKALGTRLTYRKAISINETHESKV